mmetsp:Transcript_88206/g.184324  ORF Transcript_88206/g.184324 Transcript_88206/m.184324 type:complete len:389 (-) Transcript_88206:56-1222(-)
MTSGSSSSARADSDVYEILHASDPYEVLGVSRQAAKQDIHKAYLKKAFSIHPDKNKHPKATTAFQKVGAAWTVLADEEKRRQLDHRLRCGLSGFRSDDDDDDDLNGFYQTRELSVEEALQLFTFAAAAAMAAGPNGGFSDMAETLFFMQGGRQCMPGVRLEALPGGGLDFLPSRLQEDTPEILQSAGRLLMSVALLGAGFTADVVGLRTVGRLARRAAFVQGAVEIAMVSQIPSVNRELRGGFDFFSSALADQSPSEWLETAVNSTRRTVNALVGNPQEKDPKKAGFFVKGLNFFGVPDQEKFEPGEVVRLISLEKDESLNGRSGYVLRYDKRRRRYHIRLLSRSISLVRAPSRGSPEVIKLVKASNLELMAAKQAVRDNAVSSTNFL